MLDFRGVDSKLQSNHEKTRLRTLYKSMHPAPCTAKDVVVKSLEIGGYL